MSSGGLRVVVLVDAQHTHELVGALTGLLRRELGEILFVYVSAPGPRAGLDMVTHRPGGGHLPPERELEIGQAEAARGQDALREAEQLAGGLAPSVRSVLAQGKPGEVVCELAARHGAGLVVVRAGGPDRPPVGPGSLGPAARFITDHSPCPVLLLR